MKSSVAAVLVVALLCLVQAFVTMMHIDVVDMDAGVQLVNLGSSYKYDGGAEFLCVVSRQCPSMQNGQCTEPTDRGKVSVMSGSVDKTSHNLDIVLPPLVF